MHTYLSINYKITKVFYGVDNKKDITSVVQFWPRKDKEGCLKAEDVTAC